MAVCFVLNRCLTVPGPFRTSEGRKWQTANDCSERRISVGGEDRREGPPGAQKKTSDALLASLFPAPLGRSRRTPNSTETSRAPKRSCQKSARKPSPSPRSQTPPRCGQGRCGISGGPSRARGPERRLRGPLPSELGPACPNRAGALRDLPARKTSGARWSWPTPLTASTAPVPAGPIAPLWRCRPRGAASGAALLGAAPAPARASQTRARGQHAG